MMKQALLPANLHPAYGWTEAAGELDELRDLRGHELAVYIRESVANAVDNDVVHGEQRTDVTASDLEDLHDWLVEHQPKSG